MRRWVFCFQHYRNSHKAGRCWLQQDCPEIHTVQPQGCRCWMHTGLGRTIPLVLPSQDLCATHKVDINSQKTLIPMQMYLFASLPRLKSMLSWPKQSTLLKLLWQTDKMVPQVAFMWKGFCSYRRGQQLSGTTSLGSEMLCTFCADRPDSKNRSIPLHNENETM